MDRSIEEAREATRTLRSSQEPPWPQIRASLIERGVDPTHAAMGAWFMEQSGPNCNIVDRDRNAVEVEFEWSSGRILSWNEEGPRHHPDEVFGALTILEEEDPTGADPVDALTAWCSHLTEEFRQDWTAHWEPVKALIEGVGVDPERCILVEHIISGGDNAVLLMPDGGFVWVRGASDLERIDETTLVTERHIMSTRIRGARRLWEQEASGNRMSDDRTPGPDRPAIRDRVLEVFGSFDRTVAASLPQVGARPEVERHGDGLHITLWFRLPSTPSIRKGEVWILFAWARAKGFYRRYDLASPWPELPFADSDGDGLDLVIRASDRLGGYELSGSLPTLLPEDRSSAEYTAAVETFVEAIPTFLSDHQDLIFAELERRLARE